MALRNTAVRLLGAHRYQSAKFVYRTWSRAELRLPLPWSQKWWAWSRGFTVKSASLYDRAGIEAGDYVSDHARAVQCSELNSIPTVLNHKLLLRGLLAARNVRQPELIAFISDRRLLVDMEEVPREVGQDELLAILLKDKGPYIWKPENGQRGQDIVRLEVVDGALVARRGLHVEPFRLRRAPGEAYLIERVVRQHAFWDALFPGSVNTIRALTMWTPGDPAPFLAVAIQRIGRDATAPTDNFAGGGIAAPVNLENGVLSIGIVKKGKGKGLSAIEHHATHPDTGAQVENAVLPNWPRIKAFVLEAARSIPHQSYVGWDVAIGIDGEPLIIEGNGNSDVDILQLDGGLLANPAARRFYEKCGVAAAKTAN